MKLLETVFYDVLSTHLLPGMVLLACCLGFFRRLKVWQVALAALLTSCLQRALQTGDPARQEYLSPSIWWLWLVPWFCLGVLVWYRTLPSSAPPPKPATELRPAWILLPWFVSRVALLGLTWLAAQTPLPEPGLAGTPPGLQLWCRWDTAFYLSIATDGYSYQPGQGGSMAFFPLFPLLVRMLALPLQLALPPLPAAAVAAALLNNLVFFPLGLWGLFHWVHRLSGDVACARRAVWLCALSPVSFFASALYTEALYLALTSWALVARARGRSLPFTVLAGLAAVTRPQGLFFTACLGLEWLWSVRRQPREWLLALWLALPFSLFVGYQAWRFGEPLAFLDTQGAWGQHLGLLRAEIHAFRLFHGGYEFWMQHLNYLALVLAVVLAPRVMRLASPGLAMALLLAAAVPALRTLLSNARFVFFQPPLFLALASLLRGPAFVLYCVLFGLMQLALCWGFLGGEWVN